MKTINGIYTTADIFTTSDVDTAIDDYAIHQIQMLCDNETAKNSKIRVTNDNITEDISIKILGIFTTANIN